MSQGHLNISYNTVFSESHCFFVKKTWFLGTVKSILQKDKVFPGITHFCTIKKASYFLLSMGNLPAYDLLTDSYMNCTS